MRPKLYSGPGQEEFKTKNLFIDLYQRFERQDVSVYADNYYSSKELCSAFHSRGIKYTWKIRVTSKGLPVNLKNYVKDLQKGQSINNKQHENVLSCWKDKKAVKVISNFYGAESILEKGKKIPLALKITELIWAELISLIKCFSTTLIRINLQSGGSFFLSIF